MKTINIIKIMAVVTLTLLLSTNMFAQDKPAEPAKSMEKHVCTDECKTDGCTAMGSKTAKAEHKCTDECHEIGCAAVDAKAAKANSSKHVCTAECKTEGCAAVKAKTAKHVCTDECKTDGCTAANTKDGVSYECPMKCEPASSEAGECSKCGMDLKKKA